MSALQVEVGLSGNKLSAKLTPDDGLKEGDRFYTYLLKSGAVLARSESWTAASEAVYVLGESGLYSIQAHIKRNGNNTISYSTPVLYLGPEDRHEYNDWLEGAVGELNDSLVDDVFLSSEPYVDFLLISSAGVIDLKPKAKKFSKRFGFELVGLDDKGANLILAQPGHVRGGDQSFVFSGSCFIDDRLIFGDSDLLDDGIKSIVEAEPVGNYTYFSIDPVAGRLLVGKDYFGIAKVYYLLADGVALISNNYHLLLLLASELGVILEIDTEKASANLVFATIQQFHQNFSRQMDVRPVNVLEADSSIEICNGEFRLLKTSLAEVLERPPAYDQGVYETLLQAAKSEVISNVKAVLEHSKFDHVICDLSGGMDSRLVFCALTHFPQHYQRVRINSHYSAAEPDDLVVAQELASFYDMGFDDLEREQVEIKGEFIASAHWSYNLGSYYSYIPLSQGKRIPGAARLNGFYGEICARPYYSRLLFDTEMDCDSVGDFCERYFSKHRKSAVNSSAATLKLLERLFAEELSLIPGRTSLEKLENHYLFYRNGLHCSDRFRSSLSCPEFGPIQSKSLNLAKVMSYQVFRGAKVQFDIINLLNPALASVRYQSDFDNKDRELVRDKYGVLGERWAENIQLHPVDVSEAWKAAGKRVVTRQLEGGQEAQRKLGERLRGFDADHFRLSFVFLKELYKGEVIVSEDLLKSLWFIYQRPESTSLAMRWNILNRLASLHTQMRIVKKTSKKCDYQVGM